MTGKEFKNVILFMANAWTREMAHEVFGEIMGDHFYDKWHSAGGGDKGTMTLFYEMSDWYLEDLCRRANEYFANR